MKRLIGCALAVLAIGLWARPADAARSYTIGQTPAAPTSFPMGTNGTLTYRITNTNNGGNTGERIYEMRFRLRGTGTTFASSTAAPAGWTRTAYSTTSVTFRATSWANAIAVGAFRDFAINFTFRSTTADVNETLRDIRARYTTSTTGPPFGRVGTVTTNNPGSWTLKSLVITSFQITDLSGTPITSLVAGSSFRLVMAVTNRSTATQTAIVSSPLSPTQVASFAGTPPTPPWLASTAYSPNPLTLAPGASGTITFTYNTSTTGYGTVYYTAYARNNTNSATSALATSPTLAIGLFVAGVVTSPSCLYNGGNVTVTMTLTNRYNYDLINVTPTLTPSAGAPITLSSGPTALSGTTATANGGTLQFQWVFLVSGALPGQTFWFDGSATGTGTGGNPSRTTPTATSAPPVTAAGFVITVIPDRTNVSSTNEEITWSFTNQGCFPVDSVAIGLPASGGWIWSGDAYSLAAINAATSVETWGVSGTDPVVFTAPVATDQLYLTGSGEYRLTFSATPGTPGPVTFNVTITDSSGASQTVATTVTLDTFNTNSLNDAGGLMWQEQVR
ncbi:MAG: hypothetical protein ACOYXR_02440 [Nitrospirota bacterium]